MSPNYFIITTNTITTNYYLLVTLDTHIIILRLKMQLLWVCIPLLWVSFLHLHRCLLALLFSKLGLELSQLVLPCLDVQLVLQHLLLSCCHPQTLVLAGGAYFERGNLSHLAFLLEVWIKGIGWLSHLLGDGHMHLAVEAELRQLGIVGGCHLGD